MDDGIGKEITTQIRTTMKTNKTFYTDSNGRDFIKRVCQYLIPTVYMICSILVRFSCVSDNWNAVKVLEWNKTT